MDSVTLQLADYVLHSEQIIQTISSLVLRSPLTQLHFPSLGKLPCLSQSYVSSCCRDFHGIFLQTQFQPACPWIPDSLFQTSTMSLDCRLSIDQSSARGPSSDTTLTGMQLLMYHGVNSKINTSFIEVVHCSTCRTARLERAHDRQVRLSLNKKIPNPQ